MNTKKFYANPNFNWKQKKISSKAQARAYGKGCRGIKQKKNFFSIWANYSLFEKIDGCKAKTKEKKYFRNKLLGSIIINLNKPSWY